MSKKRLVGGEFLLDLSMMSFVASVDAETFTAISNAEVLSQLTDLKTYVKSQKSIKPIWVKMKDSESYFVARGELQKVINQPNFVLVIKAKDKILTIQVEFTQVLNEDDVPMDDWYIDTGDAGYNFIDSNYYVDVNAVRKIPAPESTTLTEEEFEIIKDGVFIEGSFLTVANPVLYPPYKDGDYWYGIFIGGASFGRYAIKDDTRVISMSGEASRSLQLRSIAAINGKTYPSYPASDVRKHFISDNGILKWDDINLADIVDSDGNKRFVEGDITIHEISGITQSYGKWSLSGTHLMIVVAISLADTTAITSGTILCQIDVPQWVKDKIVPIVGTYVDRIQQTYYDSVLAKQDMNVSLRLDSTYGLYITLGSLTLTADRTGRIVFDLLIDTDSGE